MMILPKMYAEIPKFKLTPNDVWSTGEREVGRFGVVAINAWGWPEVASATAGPADSQQRQDRLG